MREDLEVVDADGHVQEPADVWDRYLDKEYYEYRPIIDPRATDNAISVMGRAMIRSFVPEPGSDFRDVMVRRWNTRFRDQFVNGFTAESYIAAMDSEGIDTMVLYPGRGLYAVAIDDMDGLLASAICRAYNRWLAEFCSFSNRLVGVGLVALHEPATAAPDVDYAIGELGHHGIMIRPNPYRGRNLNDSRYDDFYAAVAESGVPLGIHEGAGVWMPEYGADRYRESHLISHTLCHPMEQMAAASAMTAGGVMERHPGLQVVFLESGGGWLPYLLERLDEHFEWLEDVPSETGHLRARPSEYFRRQGWISCEANESSLRSVADSVGAERMVWASDYPHPDAEFPGVVDHLVRASGLTQEEMTLYAGASAKRLYRLD
jgi:predicted TIM-barrel fold metal-dependent hydrolase